MQDAITKITAALGHLKDLALIAMKGSPYTIVQRAKILMWLEGELIDLLYRLQYQVSVSQMQATFCSTCKRPWVDGTNNANRTMTFCSNGYHFVEAIEQGLLNCCIHENEIANFAYQGKAYCHKDKIYELVKREKIDLNN